MPENDFEKQVQQLFDELRLKPSAEVWTKVNSRIQKERKYKRFLLWIPLLVLFVGSGVYLFLLNPDKSFSFRQADTIRPNKKRTDDGQAMNSQEKQPAPESFKKEISANGLKEAKKTLPVTRGANEQQYNDGLGSGSNASNGNVLSLKPPVNKQATGKAQQTLSDVYLPVPDNAGIPITINRNTTISHSQTRSFREENGTVGINNRSQFPPVTGERQQVTMKTSMLPGVESESWLGNAVKAPVLSPPVALKKKKYWEWGITGGAGLSAAGKNLSEFLGAHPAEKSGMNLRPGDLNFSTNTGMLTGQNGMLAAMPPPASVVEKGVAWQAGGFVKRSVTNRLLLNGGLLYEYFSTHRLVGNYIGNYGILLNNTRNEVNASYAGNYSGGTGFNYINRYHFIEMPVGVQWQINPFAKLPLQVGGGISLSYLLHSTAVHYHPQTGSYYKDNSLFNKIQTGVFADASAKFFATSRRPLYIGPFVQYNLSQLIKSGVKSSEQHFIIGGLKAQWVLGKN